MRAVNSAAQALRAERGGLAERWMVWIAARHRDTPWPRGARALVRRGRRDDHRHRPLDRGVGDPGLPGRGVASRRRRPAAPGGADRAPGAARPLGDRRDGDRRGPALRRPRRPAADLEAHALDRDRAPGRPARADVQGLRQPGADHPPGGRRRARRSSSRRSPRCGSSPSRPAARSPTRRNSSAMATASAATSRSPAPSTCRGARRTAATAPDLPSSLSPSSKDLPAMQRLPDWRARLGAHIAAHRTRPFAYGAHDCATFAAGAVQAVTGSDPAAGLTGYTTRAGGLRRLRRNGLEDHVAFVASRFAEIPVASRAAGRPRGDRGRGRAQSRRRLRRLRARPDPALRPRRGAAHPDRRRRPRPQGLPGMTLLLALALLLAGAAPAAADPVSGTIAAFLATTGAALNAAAFAVGGALGLSATATWWLVGVFQQTALGVALSAIGRALMPKPRSTTPGVKQSVQLGDDAPGTIILGRYATAGDLVYVGSHGEKNKYYTFVVELADFPARLRRVMVNGAWCTLSASSDPLYGKPVVEYRRKGKDRLWVRFHDGTQTAPDHGLRTVYGDDPFRPWEADMLGLGVPYAVVTACYDPEVHRGVPKVLFELDGARLYDPRQDSSVGGAGPQRWSDPSSWTPFGGGANENPVVQIYNLMLGLRDPVTDAVLWGGRDIAQDDLPVASWFAAMNACDADAHGADGVEPQYRAGLEISFTDDGVVADAIEELLEGLPGPDRRGGGQLDRPGRRRGACGLRLQRRRRDRHQPGGLRPVPRPRAGVQRRHRHLLRARGRLAVEGGAEALQRRLPRRGWPAAGRRPRLPGGQPPLPGAAADGLGAEGQPPLPPAYRGAAAGGPGARAARCRGLDEPAQRLRRQALRHRPRRRPAVGLRRGLAPRDRPRRLRLRRGRPPADDDRLSRPAAAAAAADRLLGRRRRGAGRLRRRPAPGDPAGLEPGDPGRGRALAVSAAGARGPGAARRRRGLLRRRPGLGRPRGLRRRAARGLRGRRPVARLHLRTSRPARRSSSPASCRRRNTRCGCATPAAAGATGSRS